MKGVTWRRPTLATIGGGSTANTLALLANLSKKLAFRSVTVYDTPNPMSSFFYRFVPANSEHKLFALADTSEEQIPASLRRMLELYPLHRTDALPRTFLSDLENYTTAMRRYNKRTFFFPYTEHTTTPVSFVRETKTRDVPVYELLDAEKNLLGEANVVLCAQGRHRKSLPSNIEEHLRAADELALPDALTPAVFAEGLLSYDEVHVIGSGLSAAQSFTNLLNRGAKHVYLWHNKDGVSCITDLFKPSTKSRTTRSRPFSGIREKPYHALLGALSGRTNYTVNHVANLTEHPISAPSAYVNATGLEINPITFITLEGDEYLITKTAQGTLGQDPPNVVVGPVGEEVEKKFLYGSGIAYPVEYHADVLPRSHPYRYADEAVGAKMSGTKFSLLQMQAVVADLEAHLSPPRLSYGALHKGLRHFSQKFR